VTLLPATVVRSTDIVFAAPGKNVSYNNSYQTQTMAGSPKFAAFISQLNVTYAPLYDIKDNCAQVKVPGGGIFGNHSTPTLNGTIFIAITDADLYVTPFNTSYINTHVVAGPAIFQSG
jgi:hypothetical protein